MTDAEGTALAAKVGLFLEEIAYFMEAYVLWGGKGGLGAD